MTEFTSSVEGWLVLENQAATKTYELFVKRFSWDWVYKPKITHFPDEGHFAYDLSDFHLQFLAQQVFVTDYDDFTGFLVDIKSFQEDGYFTLKMKRKADGSLIKFDGTNSSINVLLKKGLRMMEKWSNGDIQVYVIGQMMFEQAA